MIIPLKNAALLNINVPFQNHFHSSFKEIFFILMHLAHKVSGKKTYFTVQKFTKQKSVMTKTAVL